MLPDDQGARIDVPQAQQIGVPADHAVLRLAKCHGVAEQHPLDADYRQGDHAVHHCPQNVLAPSHAAVEESQTRRHEHDQGRRDQHPGGVAGI